MFNYKKIFNKYSNYIYIGLQLILLLTAVEIGGIWLTIYIIFQILHGIYYSYKNRLLLKGIAEYILYSKFGKEYLDYKVRESKKKKK